MKCSIYSQKPQKCGSVMPWLMMHKYALTLRHLWFYLDEEQVWLLYVRFHLPQLELLPDIGSWVKRRLKWWQ